MSQIHKQFKFSSMKKKKKTEKDDYGTIYKIDYFTVF